MIPGKNRKPGHWSHNSRKRRKKNLSRRLTRESGVGLDYRVFRRVSGLFRGRAFGIPR
ncbi:MAG: hypothetical protein ACTSRA_02000 [Promethearchaeota archaeon]